MMNCLVIEDEIEAQDILMGYIEKTHFLKAIGVFESGLDVSREILEKTDIMFLDIQLPGLNGLSYLGTLKNPPKVIITTAFQDYAVEAFDFEVVDYLLKPFPYERLLKAVNRVNDKDKKNSAQSSKSLFVYSDKAYHHINIEDILFLKAEVDYVNIIAKDKNYLILDSLSNWETKMTPFNFMRVHRSYVVPISKIDKIEGNSIMIGENRIPVSSTYKAKFFEQLK